MATAHNSNDLVPGWVYRDSDGDLFYVRDWGAAIWLTFDEASLVPAWSIGAEYPCEPVACVGPNLPTNQVRMALRDPWQS